MIKAFLVILALILISNAKEESTFGSFLSSLFGSSNSLSSEPSTDELFSIGAQERSKTPPFIENDRRCYVIPKPREYYGIASYTHVLASEENPCYFLKEGEPTDQLNLGACLLRKAKVAYNFAKPGDCFFEIIKDD